jgi:hypothetical protein
MQIPRSILILSLALNVVLLAAIGFLFAKPVPVSTTRVIERTVVHEETAAATNEPAATPPPATNAPFHWSMIESTNYEVYVANLRAIGCPEPTIRDIITGEVDELFMKKATALLDPLRQQFWQILANFGANEEVVMEKFKEIETLGTERNELLKKLLGAEQPPEEKYSASALGDQAREKYNFLPPEKRERLVALEAGFFGQRFKLNQEMSGKPAGERREKFDALKSEIEKARKDVLTPEEAEEYRLRNSSSANLRRNTALAGYSEEEIRALVKAQEDFRDAHPLPKDGDPGLDKAAEERAKQIQEQVKKFLGPERYEDYARTQKGEFTEIYRVTERWNLPRDAAVKVYDIRQSAMEQAGQLGKDKGLSEDERGALLDVLVDQTQKTVAETMGAGAAKTYQKNGGQWINRLADQ